MSNWKRNSKKHTVKSRLRKYKKNKKRSSLALSVAEKALKKAEALEEETELKFYGSAVAKTDNNNIGQVIKIKNLNNYCQDLSPIDFYDANTGEFFVPPDNLWSPCIYCPLLVYQGPGEHQRLGNEIVMSHLTIKGRIQAHTCDENLGFNKYVPIVQKVHMLVILDTDPTRQNTVGNAYQKAAVPFQLFPCQADNPLKTDAAVQADPNIYQQNVANVYTGWNISAEGIGQQAGIPLPGLTASRNNDLLSMSYQSKDFTNCTNPRFKILHRSTYTVQQGALGDIAGNAPGRFSGTKGEQYLPSSRQVSVTVKAPYRFKFYNDDKEIPINQSIYIALCSDTPCSHVPSGGTDTPPFPALPVGDFVIGPSVGLSCRFSFKDA